MRGIEFRRADLPMPVTVIGLTGLGGVQRDVLVARLAAFGFAHHGFDLVVREQLVRLDPAIANLVRKAGGWEAALDGPNGTHLSHVLRTLSVSRPSWEWDADLFDVMADYGDAIGAPDGFGKHVVTGIDTPERAAWVASMRGSLWGVSDHAAGVHVDRAVPSDLVGWEPRRVDDWVRQTLALSALDAECRRRPISCAPGVFDPVYA